MLEVLLRSSHPGPTFAVTAISLALAIGVALEPWRILVLTLMILSNQLSVGISNDWLDATRDRRNGRTDKPIAQGAVSSVLAARVAIVLAVSSLALSLLLGTSAALAHAIFLASGWFYNLGLKSTLASALPYLAGFGSLPAIVTLSAAEPRVAAGWAIGAGAFLGLAAHFSNVLPDLVEDKAAGVRGIPHLLGAPLSGVIIAVSLVGASLLIALGPGEQLQPWTSFGVGVTATIAAVSVVLALRAKQHRLLFQLTIVASLVNVALLVISAPHMS